MGGIIIRIAMSEKRFAVIGFVISFITGIFCSGETCINSKQFTPEP
jgi:hypothetical protein